MALSKTSFPTFFKLGIYMKNFTYSKKYSYLLYHTNPEIKQIYFLLKLTQLEKIKNTVIKVTKGRKLSSLRGIDRLKTGGFNKGLGFTLEERQILGVHGLLPPVVKTQQQQIESVRLCLDMIHGEIQKYMYLIDLLDYNERLFFAFFRKYLKEILPIIYPPVESKVCQMYGLIFRRPRGLFISIHDKGNIYSILKNWPSRDIRLVVVTDGERVSGLGDIGVYATAVSVGHAAVYTALGGIKPQRCLPVVLDVGTNNEKVLKDPLYIGLKHKRVTGKAYDDFFDEFIKSIVKRFGKSCLIQFEDFGASNGYRLLLKYNKNYTCINEDIQGTAGAAFAGILTGLRITGKKMCENIVFLQGASECNFVIANMCVKVMISEGLTEKEARSKIWIQDCQGLIVKNRPEGRITEIKVDFAHDHEPVKKLRDAILLLKPSILIGAAVDPGSFTPEILKDMAKNHERPIVFTLSNPKDKTEVTAENAYKYTEGRAIFCSARYFAPVTINGVTFRPRQPSSSYILPGIALAADCGGFKSIPNEVFIAGARGLACMVTEKDISEGAIFPPVMKMVECAVRVATEVLEYAYSSGLASIYPEPKDKEAFVKEQMYNADYYPALPERYDFPKQVI